jgi:hypothetical protein
MRIEAILAAIAHRDHLARECGRLITAAAIDRFERIEDAIMLLIIRS